MLDPPLKRQLYGCRQAGDLARKRCGLALAAFVAAIPASVWAECNKRNINTTLDVIVAPHNYPLTKLCPVTFGVSEPVIVFDISPTDQLSSIETVVNRFLRNDYGDHGEVTGSDILINDTGYVREGQVVGDYPSRKWLEFGPGGYVYGRRLAGILEVYLDFERDKLLLSEVESLRVFSSEESFLDGNVLNKNIRPQLLFGTLPAHLDLPLSGAPKLLRGQPKDASEEGHSQTREGRHNAVMFVENNKAAQNKGRYDVPVFTLVWGAVLALAAYLGKVWAEHRYERVVERERRRCRGEGA